MHNVLQQNGQQKHHFQSQESCHQQNFGTISFSNAQYQYNTGTQYAIDGRGTGTFDAITMHDPQVGNAIPSALKDSGTSSSFSVTYS